MVRFGSGMYNARPEWHTNDRKSIKTVKKLFKINLAELPYKVPEFNDEPKIPSCIFFPNKEAKRKYNCGNFTGQGSFPNDVVAEIRGLAELLERLAISNPDKTSLIKASLDNNKCIDPTLFIHDSSVMKNIHGRSTEKYKKGPYLWQQAFDYLNKKQVLVPAQAVYISTIFNNEPVIVEEKISTGTALGSSHKMAFQNGLLEVIERDSFMLAYYNKKPIARLTDFPERASELINYIWRYWLEVHVFDITSDLGIATFMTVIVDRSGIGPAISIGLKAGFDYEKIIIGSVLEALQPRRHARYMVKMEDDFRFPNRKDITTTTKRYYYWYRSEMIKHLNFWINNADSIKYDRLPDYVSSLEKSTGLLKSRGYNVFYTDISLKEIKAQGFDVVKVLIPELHPLYISEWTKSLYSIHGGFLAEGHLEPHPFA